LKRLDWALAGLLTVAREALKTFYRIPTLRDTVRRMR